MVDFAGGFTDKAFSFLGTLDRLFPYPAALGHNGAKKMNLLKAATAALLMSISATVFAQAAKTPEPSPAQIAQWRVAAEEGDAPAQWALGFSYAEGRGVSEDNAVAAKWFTKAAEQGYERAQYYLGLMYDNGEGVPEDDGTAIKWYTRAAEQGDVNAQFLLAYKYEKGTGVAQDNVAAVKWYTKAAEQGDAAAQSGLGDLYADGKGVPEDDALAYMWWNLAAAQGNEKARQGKDSVQERMTPAEIAEGQRLSRECLAQEYKGC